MHGSIHLFERLPQVDATPVAANDFALSSVRTRPLVGVIRNARSHRNESRSNAYAERDGVLLASPKKRSELPAILAGFAEQRIDYLAIDGGDGTVRDVLTCGAGVFGESWPTLIVLPGGKTNALANDLKVPIEWTLDDAMNALSSGKTMVRQPLVIAQRDNERAQVRGFVMGGGVINNVIALGQRSHDLGAFNNTVVGMTVAWSALNALFGKMGSYWRRGTHMRLRRSDGSELPHRGGLPADERYLLFASTLQNFLAGMDPFRDVPEPMQIAVFDNPKRGLLLRLPSIFRGTATAKTRARGVHVFGDTSVELDIGGPFVLDGEAFPAGLYRLSAGPKLRFVVP